MSCWPRRLRASKWERVTVPSAAGKAESIRRGTWAIARYTIAAVDPADKGSPRSNGTSPSGKNSTTNRNALLPASPICCILLDGTSFFSESMPQTSEKYHPLGAACRPRRPIVESATPLARKGMQRSWRHITAHGLVCTIRHSSRELPTF